MRFEHAEGTPDRGWYAGSWDSGLPVSVGYANAGVDEPHVHARVWEIYLVSRGSSTIRVERETVRLSEGDVIFLEPGAAHTFLESSPDYLHFLVQAPGLSGEAARARAPKSPAAFGACRQPEARGPNRSIPDPRGRRFFRTARYGGSARIWKIPSKSKRARVTSRPRNPHEGKDRHRVGVRGPGGRPGSGKLPEGRVGFEERTVRMLRVRDAMTRDVITLGPDASAAEAWHLCREKNIRHLPVVDEGRLVGLISDRDLRDASPPRGSTGERDALNWSRLGDLMSTSLTTAHPLDTIEHAARELHDRKIGCLPVVADGALVGIITSSDMMQTLIDLVGARGRGSWVEVEVPNEPGQLANVTDVIREKKVNIGGVFLSPAHRASNRLIVLRLETTNPSGIVKALENAGYNITTVEASHNPEPTLEES